ncbi:MAG: GTPase HflX, partial [Parachlamydiaceae bacterium]
IDDLQKELEEVRASRQTLRGQRIKSQIPVFAIIGYTNAGKSTLLNALTQSNVLVEDKLFATLDTTTRKFKLSNNQEILLIDTVGFIRKLPHLLVAAFKSTLEEAVQADILIHLLDSSHPMAFEQAATTFEVLKELNAEKKPILTVLNKIDKLSDPSVIDRFRVKYPHVVSISALHRSGFNELEELMIKELSKLRKTVTLTIPQSDYATVSQIIREGQVISQEYQENNIIITAEIPIWLANKLIRS